MYSILHLNSCSGSFKKGLISTLFIGSLFLLMPFVSEAQVNIVDPNAANTPDVNTCSGQTSLDAILQFAGNGPSAVITIPMPTGLEYITSSVSTVTQTGGLSIAATGGTVTAPVFTVTASDGTINTGNEIRFRFRVKADCSVIPGTAVFPLNVTFNGSNTGEVAADIVRAELNLTTHPLQSVAIGTPVTVPIKVMNGGLGEIDSLDFFITETGMTTNSLIVNGIPSTLISNVGGVRTYRVYSNALPGGTLNNPEMIVLQRNVTATACTFSSSYAVNWGCKGSLCQSPQPSAPGEFILLEGSPNLLITSSIITQSDLCSDAVVSVTFTNNGTGPASAAASFNNLFRFGMGSSTGWNSANWMTNGITLNDNPVAHTAGMSPNAAQLNAAQFTSDPDGAGGLADLDLDGQFDDLPQGASVTFRINLKYTCPTACPAPDDVANLYGGAAFTDQCGASGNNETATVFAFENTAIGGIETFYPGSVTGGQVFNVQICLARNFTGAGCPNNMFSLALTLPAGVTATGVGNVNGTAAVVTTAGGVATISGAFTSGTTCFTIQLSYACPSAPLNFSYDASYRCSAGCSCVQHWGCGTFTIQSGGCAPCTNGGLTVASVQEVRTTLGYTNHNGNVLVNPALIPASNLRKAMPCDEMTFTMKATMNGGAADTSAYNNGFLEFAYDQLSSQNLLLYQSGTFDYFDASTGITTTNIALPVTSNTVISGRHVIVFNFNAYIAGIPGGKMAKGDMVTARPRFQVLSNPGLTATPTRPSNALVTFFNLATASGNPLPGGNARITCDFYVPEFYLHNPQPLPTAVAGNRTGCGNYQVTGALNHQLSTQFDEYPMEIRPLVTVNSIKVTILNGDSYDATVTPTLLIAGSSDDPYYTGTFNLPAPTISGNMLTWTNPGTWPIHDMAGNNTTNTGYRLRFNLKNAGCVYASDGNLQTTWTYTRAAYGPAACRTVVTSPVLTGLVGGGVPVHRITNTTGTLYGVSKVERFQIRIDNITANASAYIWLAMEDNLSPMNVVSVRDITAGTNLPLLSYSDGKWVKITPTFPGGASRLLEIAVTYDNCTENNMRILMGWECSGYPTNPSTYNCIPLEVTNTLRLLPKHAAIQGNFIATSPLPINLCEDFTFGVLINSSQVGDLYNPRVRVTLPTGMMLQGNIRIEYPLNSGLWQNAVPVVNGQVIDVKLTDHTGIRDTIPGTQHANPTNYPGGEDRQAQVRFQVRTTCQYFAGDRIKFLPFGNDACGGAAQGSGEALFLSPRIRVSGAEPTYEGTFAFNFGGGSTLLGCEQRNLTVGLQLADLNAMDGLPAKTGAADTIEVFLPKWVDYKPGSFVCTTVPAANCPSLVSYTILPDGRRLMRFKIPANINIPNGGVVALAFGMTIEPQQNIACTINDKIDGRIVSVFSNIYCASSMTNCTGGITSLAGEGSMPIVLKKMQVSFEEVNIACNSIGQFNYTVKVRVDNVALKADSTIVIEYHCLDALGNPFSYPVQLDTIKGPVAAGTLITKSGTFAGCDPMNGVRVSIPFNTTAGKFQCVCMPIQATRVLLPKCPTAKVKITPDAEICANETANVTAMLMNAATGGTWSSSGTGTFANTTALTTTYTPSNADITAGLVWIRFTTNDPTGTCPQGRDSVQLVIRPLPTVVASTLTVCATTLGGTTGSFTLTNADNLVDPLDVNIVTYHATQAQATAGTNALATTYTGTNNQVIYARVQNPTTLCFRTTTLPLRVNALPAAAAATLTVCENDPPGSGVGTFVLTNANSTVNSASGFTISYHTTLAFAQSGANPISGNFNATNGTIVYARVVNNSTGCVNTSQVTLVVRAKPRAYSAQLQRCPNVFDGTLSTFTLSDANTQATGGVSGLTVTYHQSLTDAQNKVNILTNSYTSPTDDIWIRVENSFGCYAIDILQLVVLKSPVILATGTNLSCFNSANGTVTVSVLGGPLPWTYDWSNDGPEDPDNDPPTVTGLAAGTYTITVTDGNGCTAIDDVSITQPAAALAASIGTVTNVACRNASTGAIQLTVSGGTPAYSYDWSAPAPDVEDPTGLPAGTYTVTVTDHKGCVTTASATVTQPASVLSATTTVLMNAACTGSGGGSARVDATGGTPAYTYLWSNGQITQIATGLGAGSYVVTVTDAGGCNFVATVNITNPAGLNIAVTAFSDVRCSGGNTGSASVAATGGTPAYSYLWSNGQTGQNAINLVAGLYRVTVTDANGCTAQTSVTIRQPVQLSLTVVQRTNVTCNGAANGSAQVLATGGTPAYTYTWPGGVTGPVRVGLAPGTYTVTVTDVNSCTSTATVTITQPAVLTAAVASTVNVSCFGGNNGSIQLNAAGGTAPYGFNWSGSAQDVEDPNNLVAGTYTVTVTDVNGCSVTTSTTITQPAAVLSVTVKNVVNTGCSGAATGSATAMPMGGTTAYSYLWSNGQTSATATGLGAGSYVVTVTDANGCTAIATVSITNPASLSVNITALADVSCNGGSNGSITAQGSGGTPAYTYHWETGAGVTVSNSQTALNLAAGLYRVTVTDANGCTAIASATVRQPTLLVAGIASKTDVSCFGGADGTATAFATGGVTPYTYAWPGNVAGQIRSGLAAGTYVVTVTDNNSCTATATVNIAGPAAPLNITVNQVTNVLCNDAFTGAINITVTGGTAPYSYNWSGNTPDIEDPFGLEAGNYNLTVTDAKGCTTTILVVITEPATSVGVLISATTNASCTGAGTGSATAAPSGGVGSYTYLWSNGQTSQTATGLYAGSYMVTVSDANGCTATAIATITNPANLSLVITSVTHVLCTSNLNGGATALANGGTPAYVYAWSDNTAGPVLSGVGAGLYFVTVTDQNGCIAVADVTITQPTPVIASIQSVTPVSCNGSANGTATATVTGGVGPYTYAWAGGSTMATATGLAPGTYTVTVTDSKGCTATAVATIPAAPAVLVLTVNSQVNVSCFGGNNGSIQMTVSGGTAPYSYDWSGSAPDMEDPVGLTAGTYTVTVTDSKGCTATVSATITQPAAALSAVVSASTNPSCNGGVNGTATVTASGGTTAYTYLWSNGQTTATATGLLAGSYIVSVTDANGCMAVATVNIVNPPILRVALSAFTNVSCNGGTNGTATVTPSGGTPAYSYLWSNGQTSQTATALAAGFYQVTVTDANGCTTATNVTITQPTLLLASIVSTTNVLCRGDANGTAFAAATGGTPGYTYTWPGGATGALRIGLAAGSYVVTVTDSRGCTATAQAVITQPAAALSVSLTSQVNINCNGDNSGSINITATGGTAPYSYQWTLPAPDVEDPNGLTAGTYTVTVTDLHGCTATTSVTLTQPAMPLSAFTTKISDALCTGAGSGSASVTASGGTPGYTYLWSNGQTSQTATGLNAGSYLVTVTDTRGCTTVVSVNISNPANLTAVISNQSSPSCFGAANGTATVTPGGGTPTYTYLWTNGQTTPVATGLAAGTHRVTVTDANGCRVEVSVNISQPTQVITSVVTTQPSSCAGASNGSGVVTATGGTPGYTYTWPGGFTGPQRSGLSAGNYVVTATDANGCTATTTVVINSNGTLAIPTMPNIGPLCPAEAVPNYLLTAIPFDPGIVYSWSGGAAAGMPNGSATGFNAHIPAFIASSTEGTYTVTITANLQGCTATQTFTIQIIDDTPPSFVNCPDMIMVGNDPNLCSAKVNWTAPTTIDNCNGFVSITRTQGDPSGSVFTVGTHQITYVANDNHGNTSACTFQVVVIDTELPVVHCPTQFLSVNAGADCNFTQTGTGWDISASDNCTLVAWQHNYAAAPSHVSLNGATFPTGQTTIVWNVEDQVGHTASCSYVVTITDRQAPTISAIHGCPADITVGTDDGTCGSLITYDEPLFNDNCAGVALHGTLTSGFSSGQVFPLGTTTVRYQYTDMAGNGPTICEFDVTVNDTEFPQITCPANVTVATNGTLSGSTAAAFTVIGTGPCGVTLSYNEPLGTDNCSNAETHLTAGTGAGANYYDYNGIYTHTWRVTDEAGNTETCSFTITVTDPVVPVITCPANTTIAADPGECDAVVTYSLPLPGDNCPGYTVNQILGPTSGSEFHHGPHTVRYEVIDHMGNTATCEFVVTVIDQQVPVISNCPANRIVTTSSNGSGDCMGAVPNLLGELSAFDNCTTDVNLVRTQDTPVGLVFGGAHHTIQIVHFTVTDSSGNSSSCTTVLTLEDNEAPLLNCSPATRTVNANTGSCTYYAGGAEFNPLMSDNCSATLSHNYLPGAQHNTLAGATFPLGSTVVNFTATDAAGNTATCSVTIVVQDNQPPVFVNCPANITVGNDVDKCGRNVIFPNPIASDNCGTSVALIAPSLPSGSLFPLGNSTVIFRATDPSGNSATCSFVVTVTDMQVPHAVCKSITINLNAAGSASITAASINGGSSDNCTAAGSLSLVASQTQFDCSNVGNNYVTLTVTDAAGNVSVCVATVKVRDVTAPVLTCPAPITVNSCNATVPNLAALASATDACGIASITQTPSAGLEFGIVNGGSVGVIITATDVNGNVTTCTVPVTVVDQVSPIFLHCPTNMIMIGNDPDQCSGKVNWTPPIGTDACTLVSVVQVGGPPSGTAIPITCPPVPTTITYQATDAAGNTTTCSFNVVVMDTQKPRFDADILMPGNVTVECNAIPTNCIPRTGGTCSPLTNDDVNDNCTAPAQLIVTYNEVSTQSPDFNSCNHYNYILTRTWTVTDCAGNSRQHTQTITVRDVTKPTAVCKNITVTLDNFGTVSIVPRDLDGGSTDNCAPNANLTFTASQLVFTCADFANSPVTVTLTVTDPCGNTSTCTALVTILQGASDCTPEYDVEGSDPCVCLDNATTLTNGQFGELIQVHAIAGQTWTIVNSNGLYLTSSPAPPLAPIPVPNGTVMTNGVTDGIDNDEDGQTDEADENVYYTFRGRHVDAIGYTVLLRSNLNQDITIENRCYYPTPYFADFIYSNPLCVGTPPFTIQVNEANNAAGNIVPGSVMVDGVVTNTFDAAALGIGSHTVMATFDAGAALAFTVVNGVVVSGSDQAALDDPGCRQKITQIVQVVETPTTLVCDDLVHISMDADCNVVVSVDDVLEGTYYCYDDYLVEVDKTLPMGNGPWVPAVLDASDIGKTYHYHVIRTVGGPNVCWGQIKVEDKLPPALTCPPNIIIACGESTAIAHTGNVTIQDCSSYTTVVDDEYTDFGACSNPRGYLDRTWIVTDVWGNQSLCTQRISITTFNLNDVIWPADTTVDCENTYLNANGIASVNTGEPSINGASIVGSTWCGAQVGYTDTYYYGCGGTFTILRVWGVLNNCVPLGPNNPISHTQKILVNDLGGPVFNCPQAVTVSTDPQTCCATAALPDMIVSEGCSNITNLQAKVTGTHPNNGNIITFTMGGHLEDFPGNNYWNPDTLAVFNYTQCLPLGTYQVRYQASDECGNTSYCFFDLTVADLIPPATSCDQYTQIALGANGKAELPASSLDDGSYDNCCIADFSARRMNSNSCDGTSFGPTVGFCCSDVGDTVLVVFRATDCHGNSNECMVRVLVEDKIKPACSAPADVTVNCEAFDPTLWLYGTASVFDNCCLDTVVKTVNYNQFDTVCNKGTIIRTFRAFDCAGNTSQCTQRIVVNYKQDYFVKFPDDKIITVCDGTGNYGEPQYFGKDCELMGATYTDAIFTVVPDACFKIERSWKIINWCTFNSNLPCINVPNPTPVANTNAAANLAGPTVSECGTLAPWAPTVAKINPTDPVATNFCTFWDVNANCYVYKQIIKIIDGVAPTVVGGCPTVDTICDITANNNQLWNDMPWWDNTNQSHDLCEAPSDICITATDACSGSNINIEYQLFLDLDGDGTMETIINSINTGIAGLGWNAVPFGNANGGAGTIRAFDQRLVNANQKYGFAIQETITGNNKTACVRFNTQQAQSTFVPAELPYGTHKIKWFISDGCGNESVCEYTIIIRDCKAPTVVCHHGLSVNIMPGGMIGMWDTDFLQYTEDNCTQTQYLKTAIRKCGQGTGFPVDANGQPIHSVNFTCDELGEQCVEIWSIDLAGNADYCQTYLDVQDNNGNCSADMVNVSGALKTEIQDGIEEATVGVSGSVDQGTQFNFNGLTDEQGLYLVSNSVPLNSDITISPLKDDNPLNGVTTYDLVLISKHILGVEPLGSPYRMIAADANKSNSITTFDIVELRKLILGLYVELPNNTSWRFVDKAYVFPNEQNPFTSVFPENISVAQAQPHQLNKSFVGVKIGDVNSTVVANNLMTSDDRSAGTLLFDVKDRSVKAGEVFEVTFTAAEKTQGYQMTLNLKGLEVDEIVSSDNVSANNFGLPAVASSEAKEGKALTVSIDGSDVFTVVFRATKSGKLSEMISVSSRITKAEGYVLSYAEKAMASEIGLRFNGDKGSTISSVGFELYQNEPNPFVNKTAIGFHLPEATVATLTVYDETGRIVFSQRGEFAKGYNVFPIDRQLIQASGALWYRVETSTDSGTRTMIQSK